MPNAVITSAGLAAIVNAQHNGTLPVKIAKFGLGSGNYTPSPDQTSLQTQFKEVEALSGGDAGDNVIHVTMNDVSSDAYTANEVGVFLEDGTLFAVTSQPVGAILQKASGSQGLMSIDLVVQGGSSVITIDGDTNFLNPPATTVMAGVVKLASLADIEAGIDGTKSTTPSSVFNFVKNYVTSAIDALKTLLRAEIAAACLAAMPIGAVLHYMGETVPEGFLLCNGASLSRSEFPELFSVIGTRCGNADSAHFNIPDTHHRFLEGTTTISEIGQYIEAGVPNINEHKIYDSTDVHLGTGRQYCFHTSWCVLDRRWQHAVNRPAYQRRSNRLSGCSPESAKRKCIIWCRGHCTAAIDASIDADPCVLKRSDERQYTECRRLNGRSRAEYGICMVHVH